MSEIDGTRQNKSVLGQVRSTIVRLIITMNLGLALTLFGLILVPESQLPIDEQIVDYIYLFCIGIMTLCAAGLFLMQKMIIALFSHKTATRNGSTEIGQTEYCSTTQANDNLHEQADIAGQETAQLEYTDSLTGLGNRLRFVDRFENMVSAQDQVSEFAVGILNLDGMKPINDIFGRVGGDTVLKQCALRLSSAVDGEGLVTRLGGDEFAIVFTDVTTACEAETKGQILLEVLQAPFDLDGRSVRISASFGLGIVPQVGREIDVVFENLANVVRQSKRAGRGRVTVYSSDIEKKTLEDAKVEQALRRAVVNTEVKPHFQPIISLQDGSLLGFEALARWNDVELGFVSPGKFIPLAEERGIIVSLTESLLKQAAAAASAWPEELFLSFNLSSVQITDPSTAATILSTINQVGLDPKRLEIEVTETAIMTDPQTAAGVIEDLHDAGVRISMDDFGTGQSSLGRLRELKLDKVKIDRTFIMEIGEDEAAEHIVRAILEMCAGLGLRVVAEGIEELSQAETLKRFGCHAAQGYLFGRAQNEHRTIAYIREYMGDEALELAKQACA